MRAVLVGAGSSPGRRILADLLERPEVERVLVAERDPSAAAYIAEQVASAKVGTADVSGEALAEATAGDGVVIGCPGCDVELELAAAAAAIDGRTPYLSGCDDPDSVEALLALDHRARTAGSLVVPGLSWTPGMTNLLAAAGAKTLDEVRMVRVAWVVSAAGPEGGAVLARAMRALTGFAPVFEGGAWHREPSGAGAEDVFFPEPMGWQTVRLAAGAEVLTLPKSIAGLERVVVRGGIAERLVARAARAITRLPVLAAPRRAERAAALARPLLSAAGRLRGGRLTWSAGRVDVVGSAGGTAVVRTYGFVDQIGNLVTAPLVVAAGMIAGRRIEGAGVRPPEAVLDPATFFAALAACGVRVARLER